jgi:hypothetical protein
VAYVIEEARPSSDGLPVKDQGWRVYRLTYAQSHKGNAIKRKEQHPYRKLIRVFPTYDEAANYVAALDAEGGDK